MIAPADNLHAIVAQITAFLTSARAQAAVGMTWQTFGKLLIDLLHQAVAGLDTISGLTGAEKKTLVLTAVASLFDSTADRCVPLAMYPFWTIIRPATRTLVLAIASGAVESLIPITRSA
jgi:hypothetical protein